MLWRSNFFFFLWILQWLLSFSRRYVYRQIGLTSWFFRRNFSLSLSRSLYFSLYLVSRIANGHEKYCLEHSSTVWLKSNPLKCVCCEVLNLLEKCTAGREINARTHTFGSWKTEKFYVMYCGLPFVNKVQMWKRKWMKLREWKIKRGKKIME